MNVFEKIVEQELKPLGLLGLPLFDSDRIIARQTYFSSLTKGNGFRSQKKEPQKDKNGLTRGERKLKLRKLMVERFKNG